MNLRAKAKLQVISTFSLAMFGGFLLWQDVRLLHKVTGFSYFEIVSPILMAGAVLASSVFSVVSAWRLFVVLRK